MEPRYRHFARDWPASIRTLLVALLIAAVIIVWFALLRAIYRPVPPGGAPGADRGNTSQQAPRRDKQGAPLPPIPPAKR